MKIISSLFKKKQERKTLGSFKPNQNLKKLNMLAAAGHFISFGSQIYIYYKRESEGKKDEKERTWNFEITKNNWKAPHLNYVNKEDSNIFYKKIAESSNNDLFKYYEKLNYLKSKKKTIIRSPYALLVSSFSYICFLAHVTILMLGNKYNDWIFKDQVNQLRWFEYSISSAIMMSAITLFSGTTNWKKVLNVFINGSITNFFGLAVEAISKKNKVNPILFFMAGFLPFISSWIEPISSYRQNVDYNEKEEGMQAFLSESVIGVLYAIKQKNVINEITKSGTEKGFSESDINKLLIIEFSELTPLQLINNELFISFLESTKGIKNLSVNNDNELLNLIKGNILLNDKNIQKISTGEYSQEDLEFLLKLLGLDTEIENLVNEYYEFQKILKDKNKNPFNNISPFVKNLIYGLLGIYLLFPLNMYLQKWGYKRRIDIVQKSHLSLPDNAMYKGEIGFLLLSLVSKVALSWIVFSGINKNQPPGGVNIRLNKITGSDIPDDKPFNLSPKYYYGFLAGLTAISIFWTR